MSNDQGYSVFRPDSAISSEFNAQAYIIQAFIDQIATCTLVQIKKVTGSNANAGGAFVDMQPLVNLIDPQRNPTKHGILSNRPCVGMQGGTNAIIIDPVVGDIGLAVFASRDISSVIAGIKNQNPDLTANPSSFRTFDMADGIYVGGLMNGVATQTVVFTNTGITVTSPNAVTINAPTINLDNAGTALALLNNNLLTWLSTHTHSGVTTGTGVSGAPVVAIPSTVSTTVLKAQ